MSVTTSVLSLANVAAPVYYGYEAMRGQQKAISQNEQLTQAAYSQMEGDMQRQLNKQNAPTADASAIAQAQRGGPSATMLTGPQGIDTSSLLLGKSTLLGA